MSKYDRIIFDKYNEKVEPVVIDVYSVLEAFDVRCPALQHQIKKALCAGLRGHKDITQDLQDIVDSGARAQELHRQRMKKQLHPPEIQIKAL